MSIDLTTAKWINKPKTFEITAESVKIVTELNTDLSIVVRVTLIRWILED
ncbi:MAG: hypothetical protein QNJ54_24160 [Prochloraceae cyanobacterium]|nr:hypothetical protein [Prochloraceae cyanobacterium]